MTDQQYDATADEILRLLRERAAATADATLTLQIEAAFWRAAAEKERSALTAVNVTLAELARRLGETLSVEELAEIVGNGAKKETGQTIPFSPELAEDERLRAEAVRAAAGKLGDELKADVGDETGTE